MATDKFAIATAEVQGSGAKPYIVRIFPAGEGSFCTCPSWKNKKMAAEQRECKHTTKVRADLGIPLPS